ncbi:MAG: acyl-CoA thioesterase [Bacteroidales bacterium]|nr:acyl-CoA thioesterase [Bacteroidales bacterium]
MSKIGEEATGLICETELNIRFSDTDAMGIVWHGNYIKYMEDGREAWGAEHGLSYLDIYKNKLFTPIVEAKLSHKRTLKFGDTAIIITRYINTPAAKLVYDYEIYRKSDMMLVLKGRTVQVFTDYQENLILNTPTCVVDWKRNKGLL